MTIKEMQEDARARKHRERAAKEAVFRAGVAMRNQISDLERRVENLELQKAQMSKNYAHASEKQENRLQELNSKLEAQKETAEQAIKTSTMICEVEFVQLTEQLSQAEKNHTEKLAAKKREIKPLQQCFDNRDSDFQRLEAVAKHEILAHERLIREKNELYHAKVKADREVERLGIKLENLSSDKHDADLRASGAEGRAKGLQDQLEVSEKKTKRLETSCKEIEEEARDKLLSAYAIITPPPSEEDQQLATTASEEVGLQADVENLRKKNGELQAEVVALKDNLDEWNRTWDAAVRSYKTYEQGVKDWKQDVLRDCDEEKRKVLAKARANDRGPSEQDAREQDIRRQCEVEKKEALAEERKNGRVQWESRECSLKAQFAVKLKSHTDQEVQKLRRRAGFEHRNLSKIKRSEVKWVLKQAVSRAVEVERSLIQKRLRGQFQMDLSNYKTQFESEHAKTQTQSASRYNAGSENKILLNEQMKKQDDDIDLHKARLKEVSDEKRELESQLKTLKDDNDRLSRDNTAHLSQQSMAQKTRSEAQIAFMAQELARALKLLSEIDVMGLDQRSRKSLHELLLSGRLIRDTKSAIEEDDSVDYQHLKMMLDQIIKDSDNVEDLDAKERPALQAQLDEAWSVIGGLNQILMAEARDTMNQDLLERIYRDKVKGKEKEGTIFRVGTTSVPSAGLNGGLSTALSLEPIEPNSFVSGPIGNQQTCSSNTTSPTSTQKPNIYLSSAIPTPNVAGSQDGPDYIDPAAAHALQDMDETHQGRFEFYLDSVNFSDAAWLNFTGS